MTYYLDPSVIVPRFVLQSSSPASDRFFNSRQGEMFITEFGAAEVSSGISRMLNMGEINWTSAWEVIDEFDGFRRYGVKTVDVAPTDFIVAHAYVRKYEHKLRAPDALHLAVARRLQLKLVTLDKRLAAGAQALGAEVEFPT